MGASNVPHEADERLNLAPTTGQGVGRHHKECSTGRKGRWPEIAPEDCRCRSWLAAHLKPEFRVPRNPRSLCGKTLLKRVQCTQGYTQCRGYGGQTVTTITQPPMGGTWTQREHPGATGGLVFCVRKSSDSSTAAIALSKIWIYEQGGKGFHSLGVCRKAHLLHALCIDGEGARAAGQVVLSVLPCTHRRK